MIHTAEQQYGDISDKAVIDLGCGCGKLSIAATMMGAGYTLGVDVDTGVCFLLLIFFIIED